MMNKKGDGDSSQSVKLVRKSNNLVEGKYRFDIWEMRVFTKMLTMILPKDEDFKEYRIYLKEVIDEFNLSADKQSYKLLKGGALKLMKKEIKIVRDTDEGEKEFLTHIAVGLDSFTSKTQGSYIDISFHPKMKPFLLQLQTQFLMYDVRNVLQLQSSYSVRIYELLKQYEKIGKRTFLINELKETLAVNDKYPLYANFKQRVILKAQEDLEENTDIRFTFEEVKRGRAIHSIIFYIKSNKTIVEQRKLLTTIVPKVIDGSENNAEIYEMIKEYPGVNINTVNEWLVKYPHEYIIERIKILKAHIAKGSDIKNPMGYLQKLMLQEVLFNTGEQKNKNTVGQKKQVEIKEDLVKEKAQELENLKIFHYESQNQIIQEFFLSNSAAKEKVIDILKFNSEYNEFLSFGENIEKVTVKAIMNAKVRENYPELFVSLDQKYDYYEKNIKRELRSLGWNG
jgi:plasmid replication initiation protein